MKTSIIIPTVKSKYLRGCIDSVNKYTDDFEIIVITNDYKGFSWACNRGIEQAKGEYICFLNDDTLVSQCWLDNLIGAFDIKDCGIVGPSTCYSKGMQCNTKIMNKRFKWGQKEIDDYASTLRQRIIQTDIYGFCMLTKKSILDEVGIFDEDFGLGNYEEDELIYRMKINKYMPYWVTNSYVHHFGHQTLKDINSLLTKNRKLIEKKKNSMGS